MFITAISVLFLFEKLQAQTSQFEMIVHADECKFGGLLVPFGGTPPCEQSLFYFFLLKILITRKKRYKAYVP